LASLALLVRALLTVATALLLSVALSAQAKDDFARAVVDAINADQGPPDVRRAAMAAAIDAMAAGLKQWDAAVARVEAGLAASIGGATPDAASQMRMALGAVYLERGRYEAAAGQFELASKLNPGASDAHAFRGMALERTGRRSNAAAAYRQAWLANPGNLAAIYRWHATSRGRPLTPELTASRDTLLTVATVEPGSPTGFSLLSIDLLDDGLSTAPMMPLAQHADAFTQLRAGRYAEAIASLRKAATVDGERRLGPGDVNVVSGAGLPLLGAAPLLARLGREAHVRLDLDAAAAAYERRVAVAPNDSAAHYELADVYHARDDADAALVEAAAAILLDTSATRPRVLVAQLHAAAGRDAEALRVFERVVMMAPDDAEARYGLSRALLRAGRTAEAQRELDIFRQLQARAMEQQRQQFEDNFRKIEETLRTTEPAGDRR
jgi:Flp pilus assembly protein TadD